MDYMDLIRGNVVFIPAGEPFPSTFLFNTWSLRLSERVIRRMYFNFMMETFGAG